MPDDLAFIVAGGLNTDLIASGVPALVGPGELALGGKLQVRAGGKSRNVANLLAAYLGGDRVAMLGRTCRDAFGLWKPPMDALHAAGVDTSHVTVVDAAHDGAFPGVALIPVTSSGRNQIYVVPGANADFSPADVDTAAALFARAAGAGGMLVLSLEVPMPTVLHAMAVARAHDLRVALDPGGIDEATDVETLLAHPPDILKPNEHEAALLTGVTVHDDASARQAVTVLHARGVARVLVTRGANDAWCAEGGVVTRVVVPTVPRDSAGDETGCGDQTMAVLCAELFLGRAFTEACDLAVMAGALQFTHVGVTPLSRADVLSFYS